MTKYRNHGTSAVLYTYGVQTSSGLRSSRGSGRRKLRTGNPAARRLSEGGRTFSQPMPAQTKGQGTGRGEERRRGMNEMGWMKGWRGCLYIRGGGRGLPPHQGRVGHCPRAAAAPTYPSRTKPLGLGRMGQPLLAGPCGSFSLWAQIGPLCGAAQIN